MNLHENCVQVPSCETLCNSSFMEDSKAGCCGDDGAEKERVWSWSLCCLINACFCIAWLTALGPFLSHSSIYMWFQYVYYNSCISCSLSFLQKDKPVLHLTILWFLCWRGFGISFRLVHESVGEGDDRHIVIQRCEESSMYVFTGLSRRCFVS